MGEKEKKETIEQIARGLAKACIEGGETVLSDVEEIRFKALVLIYRGSPKIRGYIDICMAMYTSAVMREKTDILFDGLETLNRMLFEPEPMESKATAPQ